MLELQIFYTLIFLFSIMGIFIAIVCFAKRQVFGEVWQAYLSGFFIVFVVLFPVYWQGILLLIVLSVLGCRCTYEMIRTITKDGEYWYGDILVLSLAGIVMTFWQNYQGLTMLYVTSIIYLLLYFLFFDSWKKSISALIALCYPNLFFCYFVMITVSPDGFRHIFFLYTMTEINDILAYLIGKFFGKTKLWSSVSPNKTIEGVIAGIVSSIAVGSGLSFVMYELTLLQHFFLVIIISVAGPIGDLVASKIKRISNVKDFSQIIPKQGGVLDVLDSLLFTAPIFYYYLRWS